MTDDQMFLWHHQLDGHEFEQAPGDGEGQGGLACCSPWGRKESDMTEQLNRTEGLELYGRRELFKGIIRKGNVWATTT